MAQSDKNRQGTNKIMEKWKTINKKNQNDNPGGTEWQKPPGNEPGNKQLKVENHLIQK